ncbi:hypothetical protein [Streptomyces sp. NPDC002671]
MTTTTAEQTPNGTSTISKRSTFDAAHQLTSLGPEHACANVKTAAEIPSGCHT